MESRIGIGVTTYNRPKYPVLFMNQADKYFPDGDVICKMTNDNDNLGRKGIAFRKNECLRALKDCDYVFLFDDDCFPIKTGWCEFFIEAHKSSGQHHFLYMLQTPQTKKIADHIKPDDPLVPSAPYHIEQYDNSNGCFMFLTKEVIEKVGAFDERFGIRGYEHSNYTKRIHMAGLTSMGECLSVAGSDEYLYALDLQNTREFNKIVKHAPSMKPKEAIECEVKAREHWDKVITETYLPF